MNAAPRVVALSDVTHPEFRLENFEALAAESPPGSVLLVLRERALPVREQLLWGRIFAEMAARTGQSFGCAGRLDVALALEVSAVHLGLADAPPVDARALLPEAWLSGGWHVGEPVRRGLDGLFVSPAFAERKGRPPLGEFGLRDAVRHARSSGFSGRIYALGGVTAALVERALSAGLDGVVVLGLLRDRAQVRQLAKMRAS